MGNLPQIKSILSYLILSSNSMDYTTTNYRILLKNIVVYHKKIIFTTKCDILQQCVIFTTDRGNSH